jgi:hypothetical protein
MHKFINQSFYSKLLYLEISLASLLLMSGISETEAKTSRTNELKTSNATHLVFPNKVSGKDSTTIQQGKLPIKNGIYLYGQAPKPNQIGQEYMVFEMHQDKVIGAFYLPQSEFNCFQGSLKSGKLALTIADAADSTPTYTDPITFKNSTQVATANDNSRMGDEYEQMASPYAVELQNYYQLSSVSDSDRQILATCKNSYR